VALQLFSAGSEGRPAASRFGRPEPRASELLTNPLPSGKSGVCSRHPISERHTGWCLPTEPEATCEKDFSNKWWVDHRGPGPHSRDRQLRWCHFRIQGVGGIFLSFWSLQTRRSEPSAGIGQGHPSRASSWDQRPHTPQGWARSRGRG